MSVSSGSDDNKQIPLRQPSEDDEKAARTLTTRSSTKPDTDADTTTIMRLTLRTSAAATLNNEERRTMKITCSGSGVLVLR